jgi:hypothetical protein
MFPGFVGFTATYGSTSELRKFRPAPPARHPTNGSSPEIRTSIASGGLGLGLGSEGDGKGDAALGDGGTGEVAADGEASDALGLGAGFGLPVMAAARMIAPTRAIAPPARSRPRLCGAPPSLVDTCRSVSSGR